MKFGLTLKDIQLGEVKVGEVSVNTELSINEMIAMRKEVEHVLDNAPTYFVKLGEAYLAGYDVYNTIEEYENQRHSKETAESENVAFTEEDLRNIIIQKALSHLQK